jgi:hypothetical protein
MIKCIFCFATNNTTTKLILHIPNMPRLAITSYSKPPPPRQTFPLREATPAWMVPQPVSIPHRQLVRTIKRPAKTPSSKQLETAPVLADLADLAHDADGALVLGVVLGAVKGALLVRGAAVDGRVAGGADLKLGELVKLNLDRVVRVALALSLGLAGL